MVNVVTRDEQPTVWRFAEISRPIGGPEPGARDPQTGGKIWEGWLAAYNKQINVAYSVVKRSRHTGAHTHPDTEHYTCVVSGTALVWMDGTMVELRQGDLISIPRGVLHDFGADARGDVWVVDFTNPPFDPQKMQYEPERDAEIHATFETAWAFPDGWEQDGS
jgi:quercetin dioxygenase-like cupin family protein